MGVAPSAQARLSDELGLSWRPTARRFDLVRELFREAPKLARATF
jgi:hypothetical protein